MKEHTHHDTRTTAGGARDSARTHGLQRLKDLDDFEVADGDPDIRGWDVRSSDGRHIGKVEELLVDTAAMRARYLEVELDRKELGLTEARHMLIPIGTARLDDDTDDVLVSESSTELLGAPQYDRSRFSDDYERSLYGWYAQRRGAASMGSGATGANRYDDRLYDDSSFFGTRRRGRR